MEGPLHCITPGAYQLTGVVSYTTCRAGKRGPGPTTRQKELAKTERPLVVENSTDNIKSLEISRTERMKIVAEARSENLKTLVVALSTHGVRL